jgi:RHS repeat-associated protein
VSGEQETDYYPYGGEYPPFCSTIADQKFKFTGKERDSETGLDYFGARYYGSNMGRWMSPDPINLTRARLVNPSNTLNKYAYAANNPLKYIDRDGEDITIFYRPPSGASNDFGHIMIGALNQATGKTAFLDYYPAGKVNGLGQGAGAFNQGNMSERAQQNADGKFATLTIQTSPEQAQKVINLIEALKNGPAPDYSALTNNCTTVCEDVLKDLGLDFGDVLPTSYWFDAYKSFSADALDHPIWTQMIGAPIPTPGNEYGRPRNYPGVNNFSQWLFQLYMNQQQQPQPKACVEVDDGLGHHSKSCE